MAPSVSTVERSNSWNRSIATRDSSSLRIQTKIGLIWRSMYKYESAQTYLSTLWDKIHLTTQLFYWNDELICVTHSKCDSWINIFEEYICCVEMQYLTVMTLSTSFFASWKVFTPSERSIRSANRQKNPHIFIHCRCEMKIKKQTSNRWTATTRFNSIQHSHIQYESPAQRT